MDEEEERVVTVVSGVLIVAGKSSRALDDSTSAEVSQEDEAREWLCCWNEKVKLC